MAEPPRPATQRAAENKRYNNRHAEAGVVRANVLVPLTRLAELDELLVTWRDEAKASLQSDYPTVEQILEIHAMARTLHIKLPLKAFATRFSAEAWIHEKQEMLGDQDLLRLRKRSLA